MTSHIIPSHDIKTLAEAKNVLGQHLSEVIAFWMESTNNEAVHRRKLEKEQQDADIKTRKRMDQYRLICVLIVIFLIFVGVLTI